MNELTPVTICVNVEHMRRTMIHGILMEEEEFRNQVVKAVDVALEHFSFDAAFYDAINQDIRREIDNMAQEVVHKAFNDQTLREKVAKSVLSAMKQKWTKS